MGYKERPPCCIKGCNSPALMLVFNKFFCGKCIVAWNKKQEEMRIKQVQDVFDGS